MDLTSFCISRLFVTIFAIRPGFLEWYIFFIDTCICQRWPMLVMAFSFFVFGAIGLIVTYVVLQDKALEMQYHVMFIFIFVERAMIA